MSERPKINVLFMQSQAYWGSDSMIHGLIMRSLDRGRFQVHAAVNQGTGALPSAALAAVRAIPELFVRRTNFGVSVNDQPPIAIARQFVVNGVPSLANLAALVRYTRQNRIAVVHGTEKPRDAFYGAWLARLSGARQVIHLHVKVDTWMSPLTRWAMKQAHTLIGVSAFVAQSAVRMGYDASKTTHVLNAIDSSLWNAALSGNRLRSELGIAVDTPVLAVISRLFPWKGHRELIQALARVKACCPEVVLLIVGEDDPRATPGHKRYSDELKGLVAELGLTHQVRFTGFRSDVAELLAAADIFAMPSFEEPCAVAYLEAMAMKKPVVALNSGGTPQLVAHGQSGLLSEPGNVEELASHILQLIRDPRLRAKMGACGRARVEEHFTPARLAGDVECVYARMLGLSS